MGWEVVKYSSTRANFYRSNISIVTLATCVVANSVIRLRFNQASSCTENIQSQPKICRFSLDAKHFYHKHLVSLPRPSPESKLWKSSKKSTNTYTKTTFKISKLFGKTFFIVKGNFMSSLSISATTIKKFGSPAILLIYLSGRKLNFYFESCLLRRTLEI